MLRNRDIESADNLVLELWREVISQSHLRSRNDKVANALFHFMVRVANSWRSIRTLRNNTTDEQGFTIDAGTLLRAMYDAYFQAAYLVSEPAKCTERADDYFEFEHVERHKSVQRMISHSNWVAERLKASTKRAEGEKENLSQFERVKKRFATKGQSNGIRNHWYKGNLLDLAHSMKKGDEYDTFLAIFNGCVHTSAFASKHGPPVSAEYVLEMASVISAKVAQLNVVRNHIQLNENHQHLLKVLCRDSEKSEL